MEFKVRVSPSAKSDIERNAFWWAEHHSLDQSLEWIQAIENQLADLKVMPTRHAVAPENDLFSVELRQKLVGLGARPSYRAVFIIKEDTVFVLAVRRGSQAPLTEIDFPESTFE